MTRTKRPKRSPGYNFFQSVFFLLVFLTAAYVLARSSIFEVREIRVLGNTTLSRENIVSVSGINPGENIFRLDLKAASEKLKAVSLIKTAELYRRLPSAVEIRVAERAAWALLPVETGFIQVDDEGVYIQKGAVGPNQLPVLTGIKFDLPQPGGKIKSEKLDIALEVMRGVPAELTSRLSEIYIEGDQAIIYTLEGIQCRFGAPVDLRQKGAVFLNILEGLKTKGKRIEYIDLSHAASPVVKYIE